MDFYQDEVRRQLVIAKAEQKAAMRPWREALMRIFGSESKIPASAKAELLGVPSRRGFLKIGGATIIGAAVLAACGDDEDNANVAESGGGQGTTTTAPAQTAALDVTLLRTATSIEVLAVAAYDTAIESGLVTTQAIADAAQLFRDQHDEHAEALQAATEQVDGEPFTEPNPFLQENVVDPAVEALTDETSVVELALALETAAAETYVFAAGQLSTPLLRQAIMAIGGVEARHMAVLRGVLEDPQVPVAFMPTDEAAPEESFVPEEEDGSGGGGGGDSSTTTTGAESTTTTTAA